MMHFLCKACVVGFSVLFLFGCSGPKPDFTIEYDETTPTKVYLTNTSDNYSSFTWEINGETFLNDDKLEYTFTSAGYHNIELRATKGRKTDYIIKEVHIDLPTKVTVDRIVIDNMDDPTYWDDSWNDYEGDNSAGIELYTVMYTTQSYYNNYDSEPPSSASTAYNELTNTDLPLIVQPNLIVNGVTTFDINSIYSIRIDFYDLDGGTWKDHDFIYSCNIPMENYTFQGGTYQNSDNYYPEQIKVQTGYYDGGLEATVYLKWE